MADTPTSVTLSNEGRWYLGAMNDGLFIINTPPRPSTDDQWHDRPDGPTFVVAVSALPKGAAQMIVDAHNAALASQASGGEREALRALVAKWRRTADAIKRAIDNGAYSPDGAKIMAGQIQMLREHAAALEAL